MRKEKIVHLAFCEKCLTAKELSNNILMEYLVKLNVKGFFCEKDNCGHYNRIPEFMQTIVDEIIDMVDKVNVENRTSIPRIKKKASRYQINEIVKGE